MSKVYTDFTHGVLLGVNSVTVTLPFGPCDLTVNGIHMTFHGGVDMVPAVKVTPIEKAKVKEIGFNTTDGNYIVLQHGDDTDSIFKHLVTGSILAKVGDIVERGPAIATAGKTGNTSGAHSHFGIRVKGVLVDPVPYLQGKKIVAPYVDTTLDRSNLPLLQTLIPELYYRDKPNGNRIKYLEKRDYALTGISKQIGGYRWAQIVVEDGTREFGFCALNPAWNSIKTIEPVTIEKIIYKPLTASLEQDGMLVNLSIVPKEK